MRAAKSTPEVPDAQDRLTELIALGLAQAATDVGQWRPKHQPTPLSRPVDEILDEVRGEGDI
ncbi:MAG: hypothetical protein QM621_11395 [Aeromicrobium sp.]|uniref:hypothetical protein n=1 Tax=Aeromicrobium sp. TaxID=1871063 RepID=UPI0039E42C0D